MRYRTILSSQRNTVALVFPSVVDTQITLCPTTQLLVLSPGTVRGQGCGTTTAATSLPTNNKAAELLTHASSLLQITHYFRRSHIPTLLILLWSVNHNRLSVYKPYRIKSENPIAMRAFHSSANRHGGENKGKAETQAGVTGFDLLAHCIPSLLRSPPPIPAEKTPRESNHEGSPVTTTWRGTRHP